MTDIHIHVHNGDQPQNGQQRQTLGLEDRMKKCFDWQSIHELRSEFHNVGLTIVETSEGRHVLCRVENGEPIVENIIDDYVFMGNKERMHEEIQPRNLEIIIEFVLGNIGSPVKLGADQDFNGPKLYGNTITIDNEKSLSESQHVDYLSRTINE